MKVKSLSLVRLFASPWTIAYQAPPSMGFSRQEYWSGLPFPSPGDLPDPGIEPGAGALPSEPPGKPPHTTEHKHNSWQRGIKAGNGNKIADPWILKQSSLDYTGGPSIITRVLKSGREAGELVSERLNWPSLALTWKVCLAPKHSC